MSIRHDDLKGKIGQYSLLKYNSGRVAQEYKRTIVNATVMSSIPTREYEILNTFTSSL